jgi:hypothetical protein
MTCVTGLLIEMGVRLVVFTGVFWLAAVKNLIAIDKLWARPLVALVFAVLNTVLYRLLAPILDMAVGAFAMPLVVNLVLLFATVRVFAKLNKKWIEVDGLFSTVWVALLLTVGHGALYLVFRALE